ncbi:MAG: type II toxin-antitoxin system Phd/YefM family antitoxin [Ruminococcus sp.]|nr:type II toxin-antitoxin system Phd/YefM family antitoxin [Ruminococcus sp.]
MYIDTNTIYSMTQANQNFSQVAKTAEEKGEAIIFKNNKPKYIVIDIEKNGSLLELSEDEKIDMIAKRILEKYLPAFKELAK